jgi:MFS transporter, DHA1 family, multidrug resistance protein
VNPAFALSRWALPASMFLGSFSWSFVYVSLPFYIHDMSPYDAATTLRWTGWILGISPLITVVTAPISGRLVHGRDPKQGFVLVQGLQGLGFLFMALARTLPQMLLARAVLGLMGAVSTFAFIMAGRGGGDVRREIAAIQSSMTLGQVLGPPIGAIAAARLGFKMSFVMSALMLWACSLLVAIAVPSVAASEVASARRGRTSVREVSLASALVLAASIQVFFLTAILPQVLPPLGIAPDSTLEAGGLILFASGIATALGSLATPRLADLVGERRAVVLALCASSVALALLAAATNVWTFSTVRIVQMICIAPVFPLSVAAIAQRASGQAIGFVNSARIGASFLGPVAATTLLAWVSPAMVYLILAVVGIGFVPLVIRLAGRPRPREETSA